MMEPHSPVLVDEVARDLVTKEDGVYLDGTVGGGGHAEAILQRLGPKGRLIGVDCDEEILTKARERLFRFGARVLLFKGHYEELSEIVGRSGGAVFDGILLDLGVSSLQLDEPRRGFSFQKEGPLDMRMDSAERTTALEILCKSSPRLLEKILRDFGEEPHARKIAEAIVRSRRSDFPKTTTDLANLVAREAGIRGRLHPATRTFQALRIAVNRELQRLDRFLDSFVTFLSPGGRVAIISYHSLEDRRVKDCFRRTPGLVAITRKPIRPSAEEIRQNRRGRSARLRIAMRREE